MNSKDVVVRFWKVMRDNDFFAASELLHEGFTLEWPQSRERIRGRENFARLNTAYPAGGKWMFVINQIVAEGDTVVTDVSVSDGIRDDRAITFSTIRGGRIWKQVEYWTEAFEAPAWRAEWVERF